MTEAEKLLREALDALKEVAYTPGEEQFRHIDY